MTTPIVRASLAPNGKRNSGLGSCTVADRMAAAARASSSRIRASDRFRKSRCESEWLATGKLVLIVAACCGKFSTQRPVRKNVAAAALARRVPRMLWPGGKVSVGRSRRLPERTP